MAINIANKSGTTNPANSSPDNFKKSILIKTFENKLKKGRDDSSDEDTRDESKDANDD